MRISLCFVLFGMLILIVPHAWASIDITANIKPAYSVGENITIDFQFLSDTNTTLRFYTSVNCPDLYDTNVYLKVVNLTENQAYDYNYYYTDVLQSYAAQNCTVFLRMTKPYNESRKYPFSIVTDPAFSVNYTLCKEQGCNKNENIFIKGNSLFIGYESQIAGINVSGILTKPDSASDEIGLPYSTTLTEIGNYRVEFTARKEGYKTGFKTISFSVIAEEPNIGIIQECNSNLVCDDNEDYGSCPNDCKSGMKDNYCDKVKDNICDPDCETAEDIDCQVINKQVINESKNQSGVQQERPMGNITNKTISTKETGKQPASSRIWVFSLVMLVIFVVFLILLKRRNKKYQPQQAAGYF